MRNFARVNNLLLYSCALLDYLERLPLIGYSFSRNPNGLILNFRQPTTSPTRPNPVIGRDVAGQRSRHKDRRIYFRRQGQAGRCQGTGKSGTSMASSTLHPCSNIASALDKISSANAMLCWNEALWLVNASHMTSNIQSEYFISFKTSSSLTQSYKDNF